MLFDNLFEANEFDVTTTTFRAVVSEDEPYDFGAYASQDVQASLRITHLSYSPPDSFDELEAYWEKHCGTVSCTSSPGISSSLPRVVSVTAKLRTLTADNAIHAFVIACFPLHVDRLTSAAAKPSSAPPDAPTSGWTFTVQRLLDSPRVIPSDIAPGLNVCLDVDGSVKLEVEGPGRVTFLGDQSSALIPEWMNHRMFAVDGHDEEIPAEDSGSDFEDMYQLVRY